MILSAAVLTATASGCYTTGEVGYTAGYSSNTTVYASTPDLVEVSPGVQVVADYDEPVFYTDGFYWRYYNNGWYRSNNYATGWGYYERPPAAVVRIDRPYAYAHYRPQGYVVHDNRGRYRPAEPIVRDHRSAEPAYRNNGSRQPDPVVRDHRSPEPYRQAEPSRQPDTVVRDHRAPAPAPAPAPVVRDHRAPAPAPAVKERDHRH
jgi:hypothetical protein